MGNTAGSYLVKLRPRSEHLQVSQGRTVLVMGRDGFVDPERHDGLFVHQTRLLSRYIWKVNDEDLLPVALSNVEQHNWLGYYIITAPGVKPGPPDEGSGEMEDRSEQTLEVLISRFAGEGVHEDLDLTNYTLEPVEFELHLDFDADFADHIEVDERKRLQKGTLHRQWLGEVSPGRWEFVFDYRARHHYSHQGDVGDAEIHRCLTLQIEKAGSAPQYRDRRITFHVRLAPQQSWHTCINLLAHIDGADLPLQYRCNSFSPQQNEYDRKRQIFLKTATGFDIQESGSLGPSVMQTLNQAREDLMALRLFDVDKSDTEWVMAAGLPLYLALFGRDTLTSAWMASILSPGMMSGVLTELAKWQGTRTDDWRDEDPGRMLHEAHTGPLEKLNFNPRARYYGSVTTSGFYPFVLSELWHWTGDLEKVRPLIDPALKAIAWKETHDIDGDGFYEYQTRSEQGTKNQAWKDSWDAIVYEDGTVVEPPISTCEEQAFFYVAKLQMSELLYWIGEKETSKRMFDQAEDFRRRINDHFWMEDEGFYAMALDSKNREVRSIGSNAGHLIACGVPDRSMVHRVADRLLADDLYSGWGVRTLSNAHPAFNPFSYHRGTVWPVEQGAFALGFARYGLHDHLQRLCKSMFEAAAIFDFHRLPEVFSGHQRDEQHPFPAFYPKSCYPQAWSAAATFAMTQSMLGIYPYAPMELLLLDPHLPDWLPEITLRNLQVGKATVDLHFYREKDGSSDYRILEMRGHLHVLRQPSPWSLTATWGERIKDVLMSLLPGR
jgi:glycogen debranching enzyme